MAILYQNDGVKTPSIKKRIVNKWIKDVAAFYEKEVGDISYIFCSDEKILEINNQYLQHDYYTDIITFDYTEDDIISGDIFISIDTVKSNAEEFNTDYTNELHRIIIHGILHLCGVDDKGPGEREHMTECENKALDHLKSILL
ncbi:rRNA maturation RNase YbeY [Dysgonomonas sp. OttesenSCG-928-M03]|nr:rRNA maturation RNase YbeY [Dysgonomonas sp. OttesenSCG-928-M03]